VTAATGSRGGLAEEALLVAAQAGDEVAFRSLTEPYTRELHVHCYRMLSSIHDAEDALQETLLRAWRHLGTFAGRSSFRAWLYRIATNVCLTMAVRRRSAARAAAAPFALPPEELVLSPYPDSLLADVAEDVAGPGAVYDGKESVQLAFLAAIQTLPPRQRTVLLLRDVLGWSAREVGELLETSTAGVHSALQRARATLERLRMEGSLRFELVEPPDDVQQSLLRRYVEAWEAVDMEGLVALLREDAVMTMPPSPAVFRGSRAIAEFFVTVPADGRLDEIPLLPTRANGQPALAAYLWNVAARVYEPYGLMVFTLEGDSIVEITGFADPALFPLFGLPGELPA
jgi:RNA polymerase sigma-70 factor (ECF subfamily)